MSNTDVKEFTDHVSSILEERYHMSETDAIRAIKHSYLAEVINTDPDFVMKDTTDKWADYVYGEYRTRLCRS